MLIENVLLAEFDIDQGASLTHQFPTKTGVDEHSLAEFMLPDGAHLHQEDWTIFYLNRQSNPANIDNKFERCADDSQLVDILITLLEGLPYIPKYLDIVAITLVSYLLIVINSFKAWTPLDPSPSVVILSDFITIESPTSLKTHYTIDLHNISEFYEFEYRTQIICDHSNTFAFVFFYDEDEATFLRYLSRNQISFKIPSVLLAKSLSYIIYNQKPFLYTINLVRTKMIRSVKRNARVKAIAITSQYPWITVFKPVLILTLEKYFDTPVLSVLQELYESINAIDLNLIPKISRAEKLILRSAEDITMFDTYMEKASQIKRIAGLIDNRVCVSFMYYGSVRIPIKIPLTQFSQDFGDFSVSKLISTFTQVRLVQTSQPPISSEILNYSPMIVLLYALLSQKRIIFLGNQRSCLEVSMFVQAACHIASGGGALLRGFLERSYPYASLPILNELLATPGFIAGVTNPIFEEQSTWWDILCNIGTGVITVHQIISKCIIRTQSSEQESNFVQEVNTLIETKMTESLVRQKFYDHVSRFIHLTCEHVQPLNYDYALYFTDDAKRQEEILPIRSRISAFTKTNTFQTYLIDNVYHHKQRTLKLNMPFFIDMLKNSIRNTDAIINLYCTIEKAVMEAESDGLVEFLSYFPQIGGGLMLISFGVLHSHWEVKRSTTCILSRLSYHEDGMKFIMMLNPFIRDSWKRCEKDFLFMNVTTYDEEKLTPYDPIHPSIQLTPYAGLGLTNISNTASNAMTFSMDSMWKDAMSTGISEDFYHQEQRQPLQRQNNEIIQTDFHDQYTDYEPHLSVISFSTQLNPRIQDQLIEPKIDTEKEKQPSRFFPTTPAKNVSINLNQPAIIIPPRKDSIPSINLPAEIDVDTTNNNITSRDIGNSADDAKSNFSRSLPSISDDDPVMQLLSRLDAMSLNNKTIVVVESAPSHVSYQNLRQRGSWNRVDDEVKHLSQGEKLDVMSEDVSKEHDSGMRSVPSDFNYHDRDIYVISENDEFMAHEEEIDVMNETNEFLAQEVEIDVVYEDDNFITLEEEIEVVSIDNT